MRTIDWVDGAVEIIDQTVLPGELRILRLHTVPELIAAIQSLAVRGAPALGVAGACGVALWLDDPWSAGAGGVPGTGTCSVLFEVVVVPAVDVRVTAL